MLATYSVLFLMRFPWTTKHETDEEMRTRLLKQEEELQEFLQQPWEQVQGSSFAQFYCHTKALDAEDESDYDTARVWIDRLLACTPPDSHSRVMAARFYARNGKEADAITQLALVLSTDPTDFMANREMAKVLVRRGEHETAKTLLDRAWRERTKLDWFWKFWGWSLTGKERAWYFAPLLGLSESRIKGIKG